MSHFSRQFRHISAFAAVFSLIFLLGFPGIPSIHGQTVGLISYQPAASEGYVLFAPNQGDSTYLIDKCGHRVNSWGKDSMNYSGAMYLLEDGSLLQGLRNSNFGVIQRLAWDGSVIWRFAMPNSSYRFHHDMRMLPNGNVLVLAESTQPGAAALAAGRNPNLLSDNVVFTESLIELQPIGNDSAAIVWQWNLWDHLVQDFDPTKNNFGNIAGNPRRLDLNFVNPGLAAPSGRDWTHGNAIAYNPVLDQIILGTRHTGEFYIIDHGTTTAEAAASTGGRRGFGGDFLFRWGNNLAFDRGDSASIQLWGPHNPHWTPEGNPYPSGIMVFNNGWQRPGPQYSSVDIIEPLFNPDSSYMLLPDSTFGMANPSFSYTAPNPTDFYSSFISGAQRLPGHHTLICSGAQATFFEIDSLGNEIWRYVNPVSGTGVYNQGDIVQPNANGILPTIVFRATQYAPDFAGFAGRDLSPKGRLEGNPLPDNCNLMSDLLEKKIKGSPLLAFPNPTTDFVTVSCNGLELGSVRLMDSHGALMWEKDLKTSMARLSLQELPAGLYFLHGKHVSIKLMKY
jgi:hypothetical protein